jgi:hypothetical protein
MTKKGVFLLTLIVMLSIIVVTPIIFTNMASANFCFSPRNPDIIFNSSVNTTYTMNDVFLNLTIATYKTGWSGAPEDESYRLFEYSIDGNDFQPIEILNATIGHHPGNRVHFDCLISLYQLSEGNHTLTVKAALDYYEYNPYEDLRHTESISNAYLIIDAVPDNTPTSTNNTLENSAISPSELIIPIIAAIIVIAVTVSVYYLKRLGSTFEYFRTISILPLSNSVKTRVVINKLIC